MRGHLRQREEEKQRLIGEGIMCLGNSSKPSKCVQLRLEREEGGQQWGESIRLAYGVWSRKTKQKLEIDI